MKIKAVRGMQDLLPDQQLLLRHVEDVSRAVLAQCGYAELSMPVLEQTGLFKRVVGEATDIVEKEMYSFEDRNGEGITMRPEGTAGCVRLALERGLLFNQLQRLWYSGPMFRYERPQKGRYRQFFQIGAECFGMSGPDIDAELICVTHRIWEELGIVDDLKLELSTLGSSDVRSTFKKALVTYLEPHKESLDQDSQRRMDTNPLRILDSKDPATRAILDDAPSLFDYLDPESLGHFNGLRRLLDSLGVAYEVNSEIVRGLDYYGRTVFEWTTDKLGSQGSVCGGGRYDGLVELLGGRPTPAVGFAMGVDRVAMMLENKASLAAGSNPEVFVASTGEDARELALILGEQLRRQPSRPRVLVNCGAGKFKAQLKRADQSGAIVAVIIGDDEVEKQEVVIKPLRTGDDQFRVAMADAVAQITSLISVD